MDTQNALQTTERVRKDGEMGLQLADLDALVAEWLSYERTFNQVTDATVTTYHKGLQAFAGWLQENAGTTGTVTASTVAAFRDDLRGPEGARRYSVQTVNVRLTAVRRFYAFLVNTDRIPFSPAGTVKGLRRANTRTTHKRDALTNGEVLGVLDTCDTGTLLGVRDLAMLTLFAYCGLRAIEVQRADIDDLRTRGDRLTLDVQGKGRRERDAFVVIPHDQEQPIRAWLTHRRTFAEHGKAAALFVSLSNRNRGERLTLRAIRGIVKGRYHEAGVVGDGKSTHSLRHSAITSAIRHGATPMQVQSMARHSSFDTTLGYYHEVGRVDNPAEDAVEYETACVTRATF